jgi:hypothetical protein
MFSAPSVFGCKVYCSRSYSFELFGSRLSPDAMLCRRTWASACSIRLPLHSLSSCRLSSRNPIPAYSSLSLRALVHHGLRRIRFASNVK